MLITENGKLYNIDDVTGLVTEATTSDASEDAVVREELDNEYRIGDRVEVDGDTGSIVAITASIYGPAFAVRFDDGAVDEYPDTSLSRTAVEAIDYARPIDEILARFANYEVLGSLTEDEMTRKEKEAKALNLKAKSLVTDSKLALADQNDLHRIVLVTGTDLLDMRETRANLAENLEYVSKFNRFHIAETATRGGAVMGPKGDASWVDDPFDGMEVVETTEQDLAARAAEMVLGFTVEQLEDDHFMATATSFQNDYLQNDETGAAKFAGYIAQARQEQIAELKRRPVTAAVDENLDDIDDSALYL